MVAFAALGLAVVAILWPRQEWDVSASARRLIETSIETAKPLAVSLIHRELAIYIDESYRKNRPRYERLARYLRLAVLFLNLEVVGWIIDLAAKA